MKSSLQFYTIEEIPRIIKVIGLIERILAVLLILGVGFSFVILAVVTSSYDPPNLARFFGNADRGHILLVRGTVLALVSAPPILLLWVIPYFIDGRKWARMTVLCMSLLHMIINLASFAVAGKSLPLLMVGMVQGCVFAYCAYSGEVKAYFQIREQIRQQNETNADEDPE